MLKDYGEKQEVIIKIQKKRKRNTRFFNSITECLFVDNVIIYY